ncbi:MAG TPA: hypothetical protein VGM46_12645, partial [Mesorhizobium sp.]
TKVDCSQIDMKFSAPGYEAKCTDFSDATIDVNGEATGARKTEQILAVSSDTYLVAVDDRPLGSRIFIKRSGLEENVERFFPNTRVTDWSPANTVAGFEIGEFTGGPESINQMNCIGFRRVVSYHLQGLGRVVVGVSCSDQSVKHAVKHAYDALGKLQAPGG